MADVTLALASLVPNAAYGGYPRNRAAYGALRWNDARPKPSWAQIEAQLAELENSEFIGRIAARRYQAETGGATWNGWPVHTDRDARANLHAEYTAASDGTRADGEYWKFADGVFRALTNAQIMEMTLAVREHVKACFAVEAQKLAAHAAGAVVDMEEGWPGA